MSKVSINEITLTNIGAAIRERTGKTDLIAPGDMPAEIRSIVGGSDPVIQELAISANGTYNVYDGVDGFGPVIVNVPQDGAPSASELALTGDCSYRFANGGWDWVIKKHGSLITTNNLNDINHMFYNSQVESIPFTINVRSNSATNMAYMFAGCSKLKALPPVYNIRPNAIENLFYNSTHLREVPEGYFNTWDFSYLDGSSSNFASLARYFQNCYSLRKIDMELLRHGCPSIYNSSYSIFESTFSNCYCLDEIVGMPNPHKNLAVSAVGYGALFNAMVSCCYRLKRFTFAEMPSPSWALQVLDLSKVGWASAESYIANYITNYGSGITIDKKVVDAASYEALKNDPDYWTQDMAYSRYNHDSAVETINSLPDCIPYQTSSGKGANTIKFKGEAGSATDGGAINTLTEEEIAVAAAKGWTVSFV